MAIDPDVEQLLNDLRGQVAGLSAALNNATNRIRDLEDGLQDHIGLAWGSSLVDFNAPHPNISVDTIESGGGIIRQDRHGMQVATPNNLDAVALYLVEQLQVTPARPYGILYGNVDASVPSVSGGLIVSSAADDDAGVSYSSNGSSSVANLSTSRAAGDEMGTGGAAIRVDTTDGGAAFVRVTGQFRLKGVTADFLTLADGTLWYRTDTDKFRAQANGATENLAFESYVDAAVAAPSTTWALTGDISPSQITSNQNDYSPTGLSTASVLRLSSDASRDITGLAGGSDGRILLVFNVGSNNIVLKDESASSTAANRFALNGDITLAADNSVILWYDATSSRWRAAA